MTLALHGGGAHGAFTWGVLDRLPELTRRLEAAGPAARVGGLPIRNEDWAETGQFAPKGGMR